MPQSKRRERLSIRLGLLFTKERPGGWPTAQNVSVGIFEQFLRARAHASLRDWCYDHAHLSIDYGKSWGKKL
jgi:hypothetical protein